MSDMEGIGSILSNDSAPAPVATGETASPPEAAPEVQEASQPRGTDGKFTKAEPKVEAKAEPEVKPEPRKTTPADVPAIIEERRKRQELEKKLKELENQSPQKAPSVFEDEDAAFQARASQLDQQWRERFYKQSVRLARMEHSADFAEAETAFMEAAERDPRLYEGLRSADDPGEYIYSLGLQIKELADVGGDFGKYRAKLTETYTAQLSEKDAKIAALTAQVEALEKAKAQVESIPTSLNGKPTGSTKATSADLDDIRSITRFGNS